MRIVRFALVLFCMAYLAAAASDSGSSTAAETTEDSSSSAAETSATPTSDSSSSSEAATSSSADPTSSSAASSSSSSESASPTNSSSTAASTTSSSASAQSTTSPVTSMVTATETISGTPVPTTHATTNAAVVSGSSPTPSLSNENKNGSHSGLSESNKKVVIGVVVGVGGALLLTAAGLVFWKLHSKRNSVGNSDEADDLMSGTAVGSAAREKTPSPGAGSTPFQHTLDQYHGPGRVNAASNF